MHLVPFDQSVLCVDLWRAFTVQKIKAATVSLTSVLTCIKQLYCHNLPHNGLDHYHQYFPSFHPLTLCILRVKRVGKIVPWKK